MKIISSFFISFIVILALFIGIISGAYFFGLNVAENTNNFLKDLPLDKLISIGTLSAILFYIARKYKK